MEKVKNDLFLLLPSFSHGMLPVQRKGICALIDEKEDFSVDCLQKLYSEFSIPFADMQNLRVCYELAKTDCSHLDRGPPDATVVETQQQLPAEVKIAIKATTRVTEGLSSFELKPAGMKGLNIFDHMIKNSFVAPVIRSHQVSILIVQSNTHLENP
jgi:hypothetical protein